MDIDTFNAEMGILDSQITLLTNRLDQLRGRKKEYKGLIAELRAFAKREAKRQRLRLRNREARALVMRVAKGWTYKRIGQFFGLSPSRGQQIVRQAVWHIRRRKEVPVFHRLIGADWEASNCRPNCWKKETHTHQCQMDLDDPLSAQ